MSELFEWKGLYVAVGLAAGSLVALQVVVLTLNTERPLVAPSGLVASRTAQP